MQSFVNEILAFLGGFVTAVLIIGFVSSVKASIIWTALGIGCLVLAAAAGALAKEVSYVQAVLTVLFGSAAFLAGFQTIELLRGGDAIELRNQWGGLGSGLGGWRLSAATSFLILAVVFAGSTTAIVTASVTKDGDAKAGQGKGQAKDAANKEQQTKDAAAKDGQKKEGQAKDEQIKSAPAPSGAPAPDAQKTN